jgi:hypothetical protein
MESKYADYVIALYGAFVCCSWMVCVLNECVHTLLSYNTFIVCIYAI